MGDLAVAPPRDARWRLKVQVNERGFDPLPLAEQLLPLGPEVLWQVHLLEVLGQRTDAIGCDHRQPLVGVHRQRDQPVRVTGRPDPSHPWLDLSLVPAARAVGGEALLAAATGAGPAEDALAVFADAAGWRRLTG